jgi:predicted TIM-barrel fold metal-dependent hydrolase
MLLIDADGHVEESPATFGDEFLDPGFHAQRPRVVRIDDMVYWMIDEQLFPRRLGRGCHNLGTPVSHDGRRSRHAETKSDSDESMELTDIKARLEAMDKEGISVQVIYPTLFLAYPLSSNPSLMTALCSSYNRFLSSRLRNNERLKWSAVVNLDDIPGAAREVREARRLGAVAVMILGTAGDRMLDDPSLLPFFEAVAEEDLALAIHVGWSCPALNNLFTHIYPSSVNAFLLPVLLGFSTLIAGGMLDRFPNLRVGFLEAGCQWIHFVVDRLDHRFKNTLTKIYPQLAPKSELPPVEYIRLGNLYFSAEVEDILLPQVIELVGEGQVLFGSDMPHGDRELNAGQMLLDREDIDDSAKHKILGDNPRRLYQLDL